MPITNFTARSELRNVLFLALSVTFLFVYEISQQLLKASVPNSQGRCVWSLARSLNVKMKGPDHEGQKTGFSADTLGTAEWICAKFTQKTCLVPRSDEFNSQRSRSQGTKTAFLAFQQPVCGLYLVKHL